MYFFGFIKNSLINSDLLLNSYLKIILALMRLNKQFKIANFSVFKTEARFLTVTIVAVIACSNSCTIFSPFI